MSSDEIDAYLATLDEPRRSTLAALRRMIADEIPEAEEGLSYGVPAFRIAGRTVAGFSAAAKHVSYLPHSGRILDTLTPDRLEGLSASKGALKLPVDASPPVELIRTLIALRRAEAGV